MRYCLVQDGGCQWYIAPLDHREEAIAYVAEGGGIDEGETCPEWLEMVELRRLCFEEPRSGE